MSTRREKQGASPTALGDVLDGTRKVGLQRARAAVDRDTWRRAVGPRIAERTDVGQLKQGELTVYVASAAWAQELSLLTREIMERLQAHGVRVEKVRFRVKTQAAPAKTAARPQPKAAPAKPLPADLRAHLDRVGDDDLRRAIAGAAGLALSRLAARATNAPATSAPPAARNPRAAAARSAPSDQSSAAGHASRPRKREPR
ncbi:MAG: DUF721 domain-containing protein [Polyangiaceae bacterium]